MKKIILFLFLGLGLMSCENKPEELETLKIKLFDGTNALTTSSTTGTILSTDVMYKDFCVKDFPGCTNIRLNAYLSSSSADNTSYLELVNTKDNSVIVNSLVSTNATTASIVVSANMLDSISNEYMDLSLRLRSQNSSASAVLHSASLHIAFD